ncbi:hypothetical protein ACHWQZ_G010931 [Mnemiopsis leidyi]
METRKQSLLKFLESIEEKEVISREKAAESMSYLPEKDIPPINPQIMREMTVRLERTAKDLDGMVSWLEREMAQMSSHTAKFVDLHAKTVDEVSESTDKSVKAMYSLLSKANSMQKDITKVEMMSSHLKSINKYLERLDTTLTNIKPNPDIT